MSSRVLLVEANPLLRSVMKYALYRKQFEVLSFLNIAEISKLLVQTQRHLYQDILLVSLDGSATVTERLPERLYSLGVPAGRIGVIVDVWNANLIREAERNGFWVFNKPFDLLDVIAWVEERRYDRQRELQTAEPFLI